MMDPPMAFMQKRAAAAEQAQQQVHQQVRAEEEAVERAAPARSVQEAFSPSRATTAPSAPAAAPAQRGLPMRAEALLRAAAHHGNWTADQVLKAEAFLKKSPEEAMARLQKYYDEKVRPTLNRIPSIDQWVDANPNAIAFQFETSKGEIKGQAFPVGTEQARRYEIYHGVRMRSINAAESPFPPPAELFRVDDDIDVARSEEAFGAGQDSVPPGNGTEGGMEGADPKSTGQPEEAGPVRRLHP